MVAALHFGAVMLMVPATSPSAAAAAVKPHIVIHLVDDWGWANAGWHRRGENHTAEVSTPNMDALVRAGIELDRAYSYKMCSPSRCALQSGRLPTHVNILNNAASAWNPGNNDTGFSGIPRNMTCIAELMRRGGYNTHQVGKWHAGAATPRHTPAGRGYDSSFGYITGAANQYWDQRVWGGNPRGFVDLWDTRGPAWGQNTSCRGRCTASSNPPAVGGDSFGRVGVDGAYGVGPEEIYEERLLRDRVLELIANADAGTPLFINYDSHVAHSPLQAPNSTYARFAFIDAKTGGDGDYEHHRRLYASMVTYLDGCVGDIVARLKARGMWDNTLWVAQSDNGGPSFTGDNHTANNWPLKGGKMSPWEGGIRVNAFVSGGFLARAAPARVGSKLDGLISIADWYATFARLAMVDPTDHVAAAAGLPAIDSLDLWDYLAGRNASSPRSELWAEPGVLISHRFKLLTFAEVPKACWHGALYPNRSVYGRPLVSAEKYTNDGNCNRTELCPSGCLYDIFADPGEHRNLAAVPAYASVLAAMRARLAELGPTLFNPDRDGNSTRGQVLEKAVIQGRYRGFAGPFAFLED